MAAGATVGAAYSPVSSAKPMPAGPPCGCKALTSMLTPSKGSAAGPLSGLAAATAAAGRRPAAPVVAKSMAQNKAMTRNAVPTVAMDFNSRRGRVGVSGSKASAAAAAAAAAAGHRGVAREATVATEATEQVEEGRPRVQRPSSLRGSSSSCSSSHRSPVSASQASTTAAIVSRTGRKQQTDREDPGDQTAPGETPSRADY
mmetsp:Transcript_50509/g.127335  ORF Transcript_50509/g.127335 Transcript_50509/m.127335 type:complete len:201 (+) Transcript_50509:1778-2380(+)